MTEASTGGDSAPPDERGTSADLGADRESVVLRSSEEPPEPSLIGFRTALLLFALLLAGAAVFLKGNLRIVMVVVILGLIAKSVVHHLRTRVE